MKQIVQPYVYRKPGALPVTITHPWRVGKHVEKIGPAEATKEYAVDGGKLDVNEFIKLEGGAP